MRPTHRPRQHAHVSELEILAVETKSLAGPREFENLDSLERAAESLRARDAEAFELLSTVAETNSKPKPPARDYIDERRVLGQLQRMVERRQQDVRADRDAGRARRDSRSRGHQRGQITVVGEMMLGKPDGIEAKPLRSLNLGKRLAIKIAKRQRRPGRIAEIELIADFDLAHTSPHTLCFPMSVAASDNLAHYVTVFVAASEHLARYFTGEEAGRNAAGRRGFCGSSRSAKYYRAFVSGPLFSLL